jgi:chromosome partitioning protein
LWNIGGSRILVLVNEGFIEAAEELSARLPPAGPQGVEAFGAMETDSLMGSANGASPYGSAPVIAFVNEKGGVAKTTSCVNLASALAQRGCRILCIDLDPQSNATTAFGVSTEQAIEREAHCLLTMPRFPLERAIIPTRIANLDLIPSSARLADCDKVLVMEVGREGRLRGKLREFYRSVLTDKYDAVLVDCPPSLDLLTINALTAATHMIVPVTTKFYALKGMALLGDVVATLHEQIGASVKLLGILVTMFDRKTALDVTIYRLLKEKVEREALSAPRRDILDRSLSQAAIIVAPVAVPSSTMMTSLSFKETGSWPWR